MHRKFQTSSDASQFNDLENLIGSFHTNTPPSTLLFIHDLGLTNGQQNLLQRYENIEMISSSNHSSDGIQYIDVDQEFILVNDTLSQRHNEGKYLFTSLIRKQFSLAIVIPFIESQRNQIYANQIYPACRQRFHSTDLFFYSTQKNSTPFQYSNQCYQNVYHISADLSADEDRYPLGSAIMWQKLLLGSLSLRDRGYTHMFLMEPDTRPIRPYWLDAIVEQISNGHQQDSYLITKWWMMGSIYRGSMPIGDRYLHINGNALYHLTFDFLRLIERIYQEYYSRLFNGYDLDIFLYLFEHIDLAKSLWHKFQFSDFIQNCWLSGCNDTNSEFIHDYPNTYLIHGYKAKKINHPKSSMRMYWILGFGLFLVIFIRFLRPCWKVLRRKFFFR